MLLMEKKTKTMIYDAKSVAKVIRVEIDDDGDMYVVMRVIDPEFRKKMLYSKYFDGELVMDDDDVMVVASNKNPGDK